MQLKKLSIAVLCSAVLAMPAAAQSSGNLELNGHVTRTWFDESLGLDHAIGGGGLIGLFFVDNLALEAAVDYTKTEVQVGTGEASYMPIRARLTWNIPLGGSSAMLIGAGGVRSKFSSDDRATLDFTDYGATGLFGFRLGLSSHVGLRIDGVIDYIPGPENEQDESPTSLGVSKNIQYGAHAGLSFIVGDRGPADADKDGVGDEFDRCPDTPVGDRVDGAGCSLPVDTDGDGILDDNDNCPSTAPGVKVDNAGCEVMDADGDGVGDDMDRCADTPAGTEVSADGCPMDADSDGVMDNVDSCPNTPAGTSVDDAGCPIDADGDGVTDTADNCPNTPAGTEVDGSGCPIVDTDMDGISDGNDKCPGTPAGLLVGPNGCVILFQEGESTVALEGVNFELGSAKLTLNAEAVLDLVATSLKASPGFDVLVAGHTDSSGPRALNERLSRARAQSVLDYLVAHGVDASRLTAEGYASDRPVATNETPEGRHKNRRVELIKQ